MIDERLHELMQAHLDDRLDEPGRAELALRLFEDPASAELFAHVTRMECRLAEHFAHEHGFREALATLGRAGFGGPRPIERPAEEIPFAPAVPAARRVPTWAYAAAAVLAIAAGVVVLTKFAGGPTPDDTSTAKDGSTTPDRAPQLVRGSVWLDGLPASRVVENKAIEASDDEPAVIELADGSQVELAPAAEAVLLGRVGEVRQVVQLNEGAGSFRVIKGLGRFRVDTSLGSVTALGTEFSVSLPVAGRAGGTAMRTRMAQVLAVAVMSGVVRVDFGGRQYTLSAGDNQVFAAEGEGQEARRAREVRGTIAKIDATGGSLTLKFGGDNARTEDFNLIRDVAVTLDGRPAKLTDLAVGSTVLVTVNESNQTVVSIRAEGPSLRIRVGAVDVSARTISPATERGTGEAIAVAADAKVLINGREGKLEDVKAGAPAVLRLALSGRQVTAITVGAGDGDRERGAERPAPDARRRIAAVNGLFRSASGNSIVVTVAVDGGEVEDRTYTLAADHKVTLGERQAMELKDVKAGNRVRLILADDRRTVTTVIVIPAGREPARRDGEGAPREGEKRPDAKPENKDRPREGEKPREGARDGEPRRER